MALKAGIVGLPNVGKSTLFNCLSSAKAQAANFPFCTIDAQMGQVSVPDERLTKLAELVHPGRIVPAVCDIVDIAGLVKGASKGEMVQRLARRLGVSMENVYCVGDHANDISMLTWAGQGYAPANAIPQVLHTPGVRRLPDCRDNAIAQLIRSLDKQL